MTDGSEYTYDTGHKAGDNNIRFIGLDVHNPVFFMSAAIVLGFVGISLAMPNTVRSVLTDMKDATLINLDWFFALIPTTMLIFCAALAVSSLGSIRLGGPKAEPEFGFFSWMAMLFAAGIGIGFMFYGAAEPLAFYTDWFGTPLDVAPESEEARRLAFSATLFHWCLSPWGIYAVIGLSLGYFAHSRGLPMTIRSIFYPLIGERIWGWPGHIIDTLAVISTVFGLATTLGIGATQAATGVGFLAGFEAGLTEQVLLIMVMTVLAGISVWRGVDGGVKLLSNLNMIIAFLLLLFVIVFGPTVSIFKGIFENIGTYFTDAPALINWTGRQDTEWFHGWTIFYWAWWISWSPFVGMFIARISRGRTVRTFVSAVLLVPAVISIVWFTAFGTTAIDIFNGADTALSGGIDQVSLVLFQMLSEMPFFGVTAFASLLLLLVFIVTSADSGALVVDSITAGGKTTSPALQRLFWVYVLGALASVLLYGGGRSTLKSLQSGIIATATPFALVLLLACGSLLLGLLDEKRSARKAAQATK
ncbi:BCCT family transporter [Hyphomonas pacifica]|uniref:BCCT family transporter n=1 Tax=Hyphomonas pacifica TaxID=1280941 RepID=UPI000DC02B91|nr:BCCT family transporter [Hyphomonas pacifica]RAN34399.1 hypothetical protein HY11_15275 [Hyphomonas pacifica]